ncbi:hypothetical protein BMETH_103_0 [methanotrophic bacterial endosymbiont of Bathymodiolus sp.]|nr:hypothetical protein BMETH_103_0 [methanotrophic bacterial endosymbiont of Bathymodiolus sp.]
MSACAATILFFRLKLFTCSTQALNIQAFLLYFHFFKVL